VPKKGAEAWIWYQEYKNCSCTEIRRRKVQLLGYCRRHMNAPRRTVRIPSDGFSDSNLGFAET
jgi:hypothetical protein